MQDINTQKNENENNVEKTTKERTLFILKIVGNVVFYLVILALLLFSIMNINAGSKNQGFPNIFGRGFLSVQTGSMERSDSRPDLEEWKDYKIGEINKGDLVYVKKFKKKDTASLKVGDVITYYVPTLNNGAGGLNTHRIVYIHEDGKHVITQGDRSAELHSFAKDDPFGENATYNGGLEMSGEIETISVDQIKGIVTSVKHGGGKVIENIQKNWLFYFVLPVLVVLLVEVFFVVRNIMELKGAKQKAELATDKETMLADLEAQKEELRKQILAELQGQQAVEAQVESKTEDTQIVEENALPIKEEKTSEPVKETEPEEVKEILEEEASQTQEVQEETVVEDNKDNIEEPKEEVVAEVEPDEPKEETPKKTTPKKTPAKKTTTGVKSTAKKPTSGTKKGTTKKVVEDKKEEENKKEKSE